jgi:hypothetical protein
MIEIFVFERRRNSWHDQIPGPGASIARGLRRITGYQDRVRIFKDDLVNAVSFFVHMSSSGCHSCLQSTEGKLKQSA